MSSKFTTTLKSKTRGSEIFRCLKAAVEDEAGSGFFHLVSALFSLTPKLFFALNITLCYVPGTYLKIAYYISIFVTYQNISLFFPQIITDIRKA